MPADEAFGFLWHTWLEYKADEYANADNVKDGLDDATKSEADAFEHYSEDTADGLDNPSEDAKGEDADDDKEYGSYDRKSAWHIVKVKSEEWRVKNEEWRIYATHEKRATFTLYLYWVNAISISSVIFLIVLSFTKLTKKSSSALKLSFTLLSVNEKYLPLVCFALP